MGCDQTFDSLIILVVLSPIVCNVCTVTKLRFTVKISADMSPSPVKLLMTPLYVCAVHASPHLRSMRTYPSVCILCIPECGHCVLYY